MPKFRLDPLSPSGLSLDNTTVYTGGGGSSSGDGVTSISKSGDPALTGAVTLTGGTNVTLTQVGQNITIAATGGGGGGQVDSVVAGTGISVDATDPANPIVSSTITQYTDELAQDAVGGILDDSSEIALAYDDATPSITASIVASSIDETKLDASVNASLDLADSAVQDLSDLGITSTASELNILDGATLTTTELNYVDGVTSAIQTQLNSKQTSGTYVTGVSGTTDRITSSGGTTPVIDIASTYVGQTSITTLGTIATGVWAGSNIELGEGGTGTSLMDPGADRIMFWDDSASAMEWLTVGSGLDLTGTTLTATGGGTGDVVGPTSATDNAIARYDLTTGKLIKNSPLILTGTTGATLTAGAGIVLDAGSGDVSFLGATVNGTAVTTSASQTLTNKTLTTPTIGSLANANHNHTNSAGGGQLTDAALSSAVGVAKGGTGQTSYTNGQLLIGNTTGNTLTKATLTAGTGISVTNGGGSITIDSVGGGITWSEVTGTSQAGAVNNAYILNNAGLVTLTIPTTAAVGSVIRVVGKGAGGWRIAQNASEIIHFGNLNTTTGTGGRLDSSNRYDAVELVCVTADTEWTVISSIGNITVT